MTAFDATRAQQYDELSQRWLAYPAFQQTAVAALDGVLPDLATVALVGVGTGNEAQMLRQLRPQWRLIGIDPAPAMLEVARRKLAGTVELREGTLEEHPDLRELDGVSLIGVLHHLSERQAQTQLLRTVYSRLKPGGMLVLGSQIGPYQEDSLRESTLARCWGMPAGETQARLAHFREHTLPLECAELERVLSEAGFSRWERLFQAIYFEVWAAVR